MNISISRFGKKICFGVVVFIVSAFCFGYRNAQTKSCSFVTPELRKSSDTRKWIPGSYEGIEIGKSTRKDAIEKFGKPVWEGEEEIDAEEEYLQKELERHGGKRFMLEYRDVKGFDGGITILYGERDKIVRAISIYQKVPLAKDIVR
jgi:hypothetical protein